ncbi:MAG: pyridoxal-phosphate dependent enzyme [Pseudomonadales bacterium]|nr:pyridoxal-phosphate dependent enzyme [Pseudomonadales bacterium]
MSEREERSILGLIGNTPIVELTHFDTGACRLFAKLEYLNPGGSIKDRIALTMVEEAERRGDIKPGDTIIEATAGNTGLGLALVASQKGYKLVLVLPDKMSMEKINTLRCMGVDVRVTRSDVSMGHPEFYQDLARQLAKDNGYYHIDQFANDDNVLAHRNGTGPEIWTQMGHQVDAFVCGIGTGGTLTGIGGYLKEVKGDIDIVLADPQGSVFAGYVNSGEFPEGGKYLVEGIGGDSIPRVCDIQLVDRAYTIKDAEAFDTVRDLLRLEGIMAGTSSGTLLAAAIRYCREQDREKNVVTLLPDNGARYISKVFNDDWMLDQGFMARPVHNDLRDLILHLHSERKTITVAPDDVLQTALNRAKLHGVSQLPVMKDDRIVGIIDEWDMLQAVYHKSSAFQEPVSSFMTSGLELIDYKSPISALIPVFSRDHVAIVMDGIDFLGIITKIDMINYLRN